MTQYKDIVFYTPNYMNNFYNPKPSNKFIPEWFKNLNPMENKNNKLKISTFVENNKVVNDGTVKRCMPFIDSYSLGYILPIPFDILVKREDNGCLFYNGVPEGKELMGTHNITQIKGSPINPKSNTDKIFKINIPWRIKTPKGYSCIFTNPFNRPELPFQILTGVVDTDSYHVANLTFCLNLKEEETLIKGGTPLAQVIPFKREFWKSDFVEFTDDMLDSEKRSVFGFLDKFYKRIHHKKKTFL